MKPVPPPKPVHLKLSRVVSAQEGGQRSSQPKPRKYSDIEVPSSRVPPPSIPPPVSCTRMWFLPMHQQYTYDKFNS